MENYLGDIWFLLWAILWSVYFILDGYDFGIGMLIPILGLANEKQKQAMYEATGPFWDGNEVWLVTAGGVTFAAFPLAYAALFSGLYTPLMLLLFALILRGVSAEFRSQWNNQCWRNTWDWVMCFTGFLASLLLGVAFSNIFRGLPLNANNEVVGNILNLLHPYALLGGILFVLMFLNHGALFLAFRVDGDLHKKALYTAKLLWPVFILVFLLYVALTFCWAGLYKNYFSAPILFILPLASLALFIYQAYKLYSSNNSLACFLSSALGILTFTLSGFMGIYPNLIPSRILKIDGLNDAVLEGAINISNSASSPKTLLIMLIVALIFVPLVIIYQWQVHKRFSYKIKSGY